MYVFGQFVCAQIYILLPIRRPTRNLRMQKCYMYPPAI